ncbi:MAG TPA: insulinase family protein [Longimicrobiales bacterium]
MHPPLRHLWVLALLLAAPASAGAQAVETTTAEQAQADEAIAPLPIDPEVTIGELSNGFRYYIRANGEPEGRVELRLVVKAGSLQEDDDQRGLAHFLEHMAFNGTKNFQKQELIRYLESIGMRFGADLNASTSYDHTVYKLTVPTDAEGALETAFRILDDWARGIALEAEEIEAERGVILSEWRARLGAGTRVRTHTDSVLLGVSRYLERQPIGLPERIETATRDEIARYYKDWYRPDLMAVVVVGDVEPARVESLVREHFGDLDAPRRKREREEYTIPTHDGPRVSIVTDPELTGSTVELIQKFRPAPVNSVERIRDGIIQSIFAGILNDRLREIATQSDAPFLGASTDFDGYVGGMSVHHVVTARVRDDALIEGFRAALTEVERIARHGITAEELGRRKKLLESQYRQALITRSKITSASYAGAYVRHFVSGWTPASVEASVALSRALLKGITEEDVAALARRWKSRENLVLVALVPEKDGVEPPTAEELLSVLDEVSGGLLAAEAGDTIEAGSIELMATLPAPGAVTEERFIRGVGITEWKLSNGARVLLKPTGFTPDQVLVSGYGWGGTSVLEDDRLHDAVLARNLPAISGLGSLSSTDLKKAVVGKLLSIGIEIGGYTQSISGRSTTRDLEAFLQLLHLHFIAPRLDEEAIQAWKIRQVAAIEGRSASPEAHFADTLRAVLSQSHPRTRPLTPADIEALDPQRALEIYRERFADPGGFTFVFVGDFEPDSIRPLVERYIAGLPTEPGNRGWRDNGVRPPSGVIEKEFRFGREPRARIAIVFHGPYTHSDDDQIALGAMARLLSTRLRDRLREALGGTYTVNVRSDLRSVPERTYAVQITFDAAPDRVEEMQAAVFEEIERLRNRGPTDEEIHQLREEISRELELALKNNSFWLRLITSYDQMERPLAELADYGEDSASSVTAELIHDMSRRYLDASRYVRVTQLPVE